MKSYDKLLEGTLDCEEGGQGLLCGGYGVILRGAAGHFQTIASLVADATD